MIGPIRPRQACKSCAFWNRNGASDDSADVPEPNAWDDTLDARVHTGPKRRCLAILHARDRNGAELAALTDGSGYAAALWTHPDFGCACWAARS